MGDCRKAAADRLPVPGTVLALGLVLAAFPAQAGEGRIPIGFPNITLAAPGHYVVTRDLDGGDQTPIAITADGVTLDLNGFSVRANAGADLISIRGAAGSLLGVTIRNGRLTGGFAGIYADSAAPKRIRLENLVIEGSSENGILITNAGEVTIRNCDVRGSADNGIFVLGVSAAFAGHFTDNEISQTQLGGLELYGLSSGIVEGNRISETGLGGLSTSGLEIDADPSWNAGGVRISRNTIVGHAGTGYGMFVSANIESAIVRENVIRGSTSGGGLRILVPAALVMDNSITGNAGTGLALGGSHSLVDLNHLSGNGDYGLVCSSANHAYRNNMYRGSTPAGIDASSCAGSTDAGGNIP